MRAILPLVLFVAACSQGGDYRDTTIPMASVETLDVDRYLGTWHEIARFPNRFEEGCSAVTATYGQLPNGRISVRNRCEKPDGVEIAEGSARVVAPGELKVKFVSWLPFEGDYWVLDVTDEYDVAVIGVPSGAFGWILARSPEISRAERGAALQVLRENGYDTGALIWADQM